MKISNVLSRNNMQKLQMAYRHPWEDLKAEIEEYYSNLSQTCEQSRLSRRFSSYMDAVDYGTINEIDELKPRKRTNSITDGNGDTQFEKLSFDAHVIGNKEEFK